MYCYLWEELAHIGECKFGERWVFAGLDPEKDIRKRIRTSLGVRKDIYDQGGVRLVAFWNVTELAEKVGRNFKQARMDDWLREQIGYRKNATGEIHSLSGDEMQIKVNQLLQKLNQPLMTAELSSKQYEVAEEVIEMFEDSQIILAELCARFGKTIWSAAVATEMDADIVVIASYIKTVFTSFATDLTSFEQFARYVHVDCGKADYQEKVEEALQDGQKVIAYLSLANSTKRQERIDYLFCWDVNTMLIVDEADFGAHTAKQADPLIEAVGTDVKTIIMTGTNSDRAVTHWKIDKMTSVTYPELLMQKKETQSA